MYYTSCAEGIISTAVLASAVPNVPVQAILNTDFEYSAPELCEPPVVVAPLNPGPLRVQEPVVSGDGVIVQSTVTVSPALTITLLLVVIVITGGLTTHCVPEATVPATQPALTGMEFNWPLASLTLIVLEPN